MKKQVDLKLDEAEPWEHGGGEPQRAYEAFVVFRDLGPTRNLHAAYRAWRAEKLPSGEPLRTWRSFRSPDRAFGLLEEVARAIPLGRTRRGLRPLARKRKNRSDPGGPRADP